MGGTTTLVILISACFAGLCLIVGLAIGIPRSRRKHKEIKRLKQIVDNETQQADQIGEELVADADTVSLGDASIANREDSQPVEQFPTQEQPSELYGQPMGEYGYNAPMHGQNLAGENHGQYYPYRGNYPFPPQPRYMPYQQRPPVQYQPNPGYGYPTRQYPYQPNPQWQTPNPQWPAPNPQRPPYRSGYPQPGNGSYYQPTRPVLPRNSYPPVGGNRSYPRG